MTILAALLLLTACGTSQRPAAHPSPAGSSSPCSDLLVLGFRGQGQSLRGHDGFGRESGPVARALGARLPAGTQVRYAAVRFPSSSDATYDDDVASGVRMAERRIRSTCRRVVLVGYSQGAEVVHRVVVAAPRRIALAVLMGDPLRNPDDHVTTLRPGGGRLTGRGNGGIGARFPAGVREHVLEVCAPADDVCDAPMSGRVGPPSQAHHIAYLPPTAGRIGAAAAKLLS